MHFTIKKITFLAHHSIGLNPVFTIETIFEWSSETFSFDEQKKNMFVQCSNGCSLMFIYAQTHDISLAFP